MSITLARREITVVVSLPSGTTRTTFGDELEKAIRFWDQTTFALIHRNTQTTPAPIIEGGIEVKEFDRQGNCIRDGWILHLFNGQTYLNPGITLA